MPYLNVTLGGRLVRWWQAQRAKAPLQGGDALAQGRVGEVEQPRGLLAVVTAQDQLGQRAQGWRQGAHFFQEVSTRPGRGIRRRCNAP